jgi:hypothetical protein
MENVDDDRIAPRRKLGWRGVTKMPAPSKAMQQASAIAEHEPEKLYSRNKGLLKMKKKSLHDFAATKRKGLPEHKSGLAALKNK